MAASRTNSATRSADEPTKDLDQKITRIRGRIQERERQEAADRERKAEKNRKLYPMTASFLSMTKSLFRNNDDAEVIGFSENGKRWRLWDLWEQSYPLSPPWTPPKAPGKPRGRSVNEGRKYDFLD